MIAPDVAMSPRQLIFQLQELQSVPELPHGVTWKHAEGWRDGVEIAGAYASVYGFFATIKMVGKLMSGSRSYYAAMSDRQIISDGWITWGKCRHYLVESSDAVIGPIQTATIYRGRGLANQLLVRAANTCLDKGASRVFIDTDEANTSSRRTIEKSGFKLT